MHDVWRDLRYAVASLRSRPSFTVAVVATLALGLGVTTAVASVVYTVLLAPPPYAAPDEIVQIAASRDGRSDVMMPPAHVRTLQEGASGVLTLGVSRFQDVAVGGSSTPERVRGVVVTGSTLSMLGVAPVLGRLPDASDDTPGGACVVALSHRLWTERFGAGTDIIGDAARLDGRPCTILAVMPPGFAFPAPYFAPGDLWLLAGPAGVDWTAEGGPGFLVFGRRAPGVDDGVAQARLDLVSPRVDPDVRFRATGWAARSREQSRQRLLVLLAAAVLVLVIACVNVVALQLGRYVDRRGEIATRLALGASRGRLVRLVVTETAVLSVAGAVAGLVVATWSVDLIVALRSFFIPRMEEAAIDGLAVALCGGLALAVGMVAAWIPAVALWDVGGGDVLRRVGRGLTPGRGGRRFGRILVTVETTLALVLMASAALLFQSYRGLATLDPGFRTAGILHARVTPPAVRYPDEEALVGFYRQVEERIGGLAGVQDAALVDVPPGVGAGPSQPFALAGREHTPGDWPQTVWRAVGDTYFRTMDIPLLRGESLDRLRGAVRPVLVNEAFVRRFLPEGEALGQRLHRVASSRAEAAEAESWTIAGVVADVHEEYAYRPVPPAVYARFADSPSRSMAILARTTGAPLSLAGPLREVVATIDPDQAPYGIRDLEFMLASEYDLNRLGMTLLALFAAATLLLAVAGIYGVVAHIVGQRVRELAIRMALGARAVDVLRLIVGDCARFALVGTLAGLALLAALGDRLGSLSPGWVGLDGRILGATALGVTLVVVLTAWVPTRRAAAADPASAMRRE